MRGHTIALVLATAGALHAQDRCAHAGRNALIGGSVGATLVLTAIFTAPRSHDEPARPSRVTSTRALMITWAGAWGAGLGSAIAAGGNRCFTPPAARRDAAGRCGSAIRSGALRGGMSGGLLGFLISPVSILPMMIPVALDPTVTINLDHIVGAATLGGIAVGAPVGALRAARDCHAS